MYLERGGSDVRGSNIGCHRLHRLGNVLFRYKIGLRYKRVEGLLRTTPLDRSHDCILTPKSSAFVALSPKKRLCSSVGGSSLEREREGEEDECEETLFQEVLGQGRRRNGFLFFFRALRHSQRLGVTSLSSVARTNTTSSTSFIPSPSLLCCLAAFERGDVVRVGLWQFSCPCGICVYCASICIRNSFLLCSYFPYPSAFLLFPIMYTV